MQFKKLAAITGSALMAGLSLAAPVLATSVTALKNINTMASASGTTPTFPLFVIGATAATSDVAGAIDMAVNLASNVVTTSTVQTSTGAASITGGVSMATSSNPLTMWNAFASSKQVLTATDLPDVLASGTYTDAANVATPFSQYLTFTNSNNDGQIIYDLPSGGTAPALGLRFTQNYPVYNYTLTFTKQISEASSSAGSVTNMVNTQLSILGKTWTITSANVNNYRDLDLTMLSGKNSQTVTTDTPATYTVGSNTYTVKLIAVGTIGSNDAATVSISGGNLPAEETLQILSGGTQSPKADPTLLVGVTSIFKTTKTGAIDSATVFVGADKLELEDTALDDSTYYAGVKVNGVSLTDVTVMMTGNSTGTSNGAGTTTLNSIAIGWIPTLEKFVTAGNSLTDPMSGGFSIFFGGVSPALDDTANRETISITPSGTTATLNFKDASGNALSQNFVKQYSTATAGNIALNDSAGYKIHVVEGEAALQNEYVVLGQNSLAGSAQNPFGHIVRVLSLQTASTSTSQFQDIASGTTMSVTGGNTTMYLDGQAYKVCVKGSNVYFTWGTGASFCGVGSSTIDVYPSIQTSKGALIALTEPLNITGLSNDTTYDLNFPTGSIGVTVGDTTGNVTWGTAYAPGGASGAGTGKYVMRTSATGASAAWLQIRATDNSGASGNYTVPGVQIVEGLDEAQARNTISLKFDSDTSTQRVDISGAPVFSATKTSNPTISGTTLSKYVDQYGSFVSYDSTGAGTFSLSYPSSQAQATIAVGKSPSASGGGVGGSVTTQTVVPITGDVVKLDSEITDADKQNNDLILVGGPCINTLVAALANAATPTFPYTCTNWPGRNFGKIQLIANAFATGKTALVVAGTRAEDTDLAARIVQSGFPLTTDAQKAGTSVEVTGSVTSPAYS